MLLPDHEIRELCIRGDLITPFHPQQLNPASYDIRLSDIFITEQGTKFTIHDKLLLSPGQFFIGGSIEIFNLPNDISAFFALKSSWARKGLSHNMAGYCAPGWHGSALTMELINVTSHTTLEIAPGDRIGQMLFYKLASPCEKSYAETGRYNNDREATGAKPEPEPKVNA